MNGPLSFRSITQGLLVCLLALGLGYLVLKPLNDWRTSESERNAFLLEKISGLKARASSLKQDISRLDTTGESTFEWRAARLGEVTALVQSQISEIARSNGLSLKNIAPAPVARHGPFKTSISYRLEADVQLDRLTEFLKELEFHSPALLVSEATIRRKSNAAGFSEQPTVFVQLRVVAPVSVDEGS